MKIFAISVFVLALGMFAPAQNNRPSRDYVPDSATAVKIAEVVLVPVYGEKLIESEKPFTAKLEKNVWTVSGTLRCSDGHGGTTTMCFGGTAEVQISKVDARIISMIHYK